jgi:hypothetical protein
MKAQQRCECGDALVACIGCHAPRCSRCDPYVSDDCSTFVGASATQRDLGYP